MTDEFKTMTKFDAGNGREVFVHSLPALEEQVIGNMSRLPVSIRIVLESVLRNCDGKKVRRKDVETLANWNAKKPANEEIPFVVARIVLQDFTGVPLVVDLAAMRSAVQRLGGDPKIIEPLVPVDLVVDHSVQVDSFGSAEALRLNLEMEFKRNRERYEFLKWGQQAFKTFGLVPPGIGIVHQVNLEYRDKGVAERDGVAFPAPPVADRATIGNMAPEYGATMGFFPVDGESVAYLRATGRTDEQCAAFENYFRAQKMFGMPRKGEIDYSVDLELDLGHVQPSVA